MEQALADVKVLDLTHVQAGPSCGQMLGFLGADVVKVEDTRGGDSTRIDLAHREDSDSFYFLVFNNNKRAITINLKTDQGKELFKGMIRWADVLVENFSKGMLDRLGTFFTKPTSDWSTRRSKGSESTGPTPTSRATSSSRRQSAGRWRQPVPPTGRPR